MLSQIASKSLAAWVFAIFDFYLSQVSRAKLTKESGSFIIVSFSVLPVLIIVRETFTRRTLVYLIKSS